MHTPRRYGRVELDRDASDIWMLDSPLRSMRIVNISSGGLCVEVAQPFLLGTVCEMMVQVERLINEPTLMRVAVRWCRLVGKRWHCGLEILARDRSPVPSPPAAVRNIHRAAADLGPWHLRRRSQPPPTNAARSFERKAPLVFRTLST